MTLADRIPDRNRGPGLSPAELDAAQAETETLFPPDLCALLTETLPTGRQFPDWRNAPKESLSAFREQLIDGIEFDVVHTGWSRFKQLKVNFVTTPAAGFTRPQNWENSNSYRLGANRTINPTWDVRFGLLYDRTPQPIENVSPLLPDADREGASFGIGWHHGPWVFDATEFALHFKKRSTNGGLSAPDTNFNGTYRTDANLISLNLGYRF